MFAGEESGGFGSDQFPDRDGIINSIYILDLEDIFAKINYGL